MSQVVEKIVAELAIRGALPFARFMELALYCPVYGYYETEGDTIGRGGDYYTSVSVGRLFGELLGTRFAEWLGESPKSKVQSPESIQIVEAGAHRGELAADVLRWLRGQRPALYERLTYWLVEPSERRREWQQRTLAGFGAKVRWAQSLAEVAGGVRGVVFCNELLDALPVHRLGWDAKERAWFEWGVTLRDGRFVWTRQSPKSKVQSPEPKVQSSGAGGRSQEPRMSGTQQATRNREHASCSVLNVSRFTPPAALLEVLPDGFTIEVCPAAVEWWRQAASVLEWGKLVAIDYGLTAEELFAPERSEGTLRAYYRHQASRDVLARPGEQDLTAHVNFSAIQGVGEGAGLETEALQTQAKFLTGIAAGIWQGETAFGPWTPAHTRQFQTLTHPDHLGRAFRVLVQSRR